MPPWQADVLLALATGTALRDVLEGLGVDVTGASTSRPQAASEHADAEAVDAALDRPGSQMDFVRIETDDELRRKSLPSEHVLAGQSPEEQADARNHERFLLYVAASRARDALVVIWSGEASPFLPAEPLELAGNALR